MHGNMVLPPIGPLFTSNPHRQLVNETSTLISSSSSSSSVSAVRTTHDLHSLRTPTGIHAHAYLHGVFPSSSPVKKDMHAAGGILAVSLAKKNYASKKASTMSVLNLDSPKSTPFHSASSPTCEDEKLRLSRERNRLHAQRTRIRKRELLESLKERIQALQSEHGLLKQTYEFHATAVCLLSLGNECDHPSIKHLEEVSDAALELFDTTAKLNACLDEDEDIDDYPETSSIVVHEKSCEYYEENEQDPHSDSGASCSCPCVEQDSTQLNGNGKRVHPSSSSSGLLLGSKEEREQLRRERNRLHARRARLRKKLVLERSQQAVQELRKRNELLRESLTVLITSIYGANQPPISCP